MDGPNAITFTSVTALFLILLVGYCRADEASTFYLPPPSNGTLHVMTTGYNPWMDRFSAASLDPRKPTYIMLTGGCLPVEEGGKNFFRDSAVGFEKQCAELNIQCQCRPSMKPERWNPPQEDRSIYNGMEATEWEFHRMFEEHKKGLINIAGITAKASYEAPYIFDLARSLGIKIFLTGVNEPLPGEREENFIQPDGFIGTDNAYLGKTMAQLLKQLRPEGGTYAFIMSWGSTGMLRRRQGFVDEMEKDNGRGDRAQWHEIDNYPFNATPWVWRGWKYCPWDTCMMEPIANPSSGINPTAIAFLFQNPLWDENYTQWVDVYRDQNITLISMDALDYLDYLSKGYLDGLVGQVTYKIGTLAAEVMSQIYERGLGDGPGQVPIPPGKQWESPLVSYNKIPLDLEKLYPVELEKNLLEGMAMLGYVCFGVVVASALICLGWTMYHRSAIVVSAAQPFFLVILTVGIVILASAMIPLSFDDSGDPDSISDSFAVGICMSIPWLCFSGLSVIFATLFSKTWRINRLFHSKKGMVRLEVSVMDVLAPFAFTFSCNIIVLTCWTTMDPLRYTRVLGDGTDFWNREIESYGACQSDQALAFLSPLAVINVALIAIAAWQAFESRNIESEFAESRYIMLSVASLFQAFLTGVPIAVIVKDDPRAYYMVMTLMIFVLCEVILVLIFLPKMLLERRYSRMTEAEQRKAMQERIRVSSLESSEYSKTADSRSGNLNHSFKLRSHKFRYVPSEQSVLPNREAEVSQSFQKSKGSIRGSSRSIRGSSSSIRGSFGAKKQASMASRNSYTNNFIEDIEQMEDIQENTETTAYGSSTARNMSELGASLMEPSDRNPEETMLYVQESDSFPLCDMAEGHDQKVTSDEQVAHRNLDPAPLPNIGESHADHESGQGHQIASENEIVFCQDSTISQVESAEELFANGHAHMATSEIEEVALKQTGGDAASNDETVSNADEGEVHDT